MPFLTARFTLYHVGSTRERRFCALPCPHPKGIRCFWSCPADDGYLVTSLEETFNALTFLSFLKKLLRHIRRDHTVLVILDNARWHPAKILKPSLEEHHQKIQLDFLLPYSPELNAIERVWKLTRRLCCHNRYFPTLEELDGTVFAQFHSWYQLNDTLRRLCAIN